MGDDWADEEVPMDNIEQPTTMMAELPEVKLFGKWPCEDVQVNFHTPNLLALHVSIGAFQCHVCSCLFDAIAGVGHVPPGLHCREGEVCQVPPPLRWKVSFRNKVQRSTLHCTFLGNLI